MFQSDNFAEFRTRAQSDCTAVFYARKIGRQKYLPASSLTEQFPRASPSLYRNKCNHKEFDELENDITHKCRLSSNRTESHNRLDQPHEQRYYQDCDNLLDGHEKYTNTVTNNGGFHNDQHGKISSNLRTNATYFKGQFRGHGKRSPSPYRSSHNLTYHSEQNNNYHRIGVTQETKDFQMIQERSSPSCYKSRGVSLNPRAVSDTHHARSTSCRTKTKRPIDLVCETTMRPRTQSMPTRFGYERPRRRDDSEPGDNMGNFYRVRSFSTSHKGIVNRGDSLKRNQAAKSQTNMSQAGNTDMVEQPTDKSPNKSAVYRVGVVGSSGVGKSSLIRQFMTSEYMGNKDSLDEGGKQQTVCVVVDQEESSLTFLDAPSMEEGDIQAYIVVYSVNDYDSFDDAVETLYDMTKTSTGGGKTTPRLVTCPMRSGKHPVMILVANKGDIVRGRRVTPEEGKTMARRYHCKYIEVSSVLNHRVDELLVGVVKQIKRINRKSHKSHGFLSSEEGCLDHLVFGAVGKLFRKNVDMFRSCDNVAF